MKKLMVLTAAMLATLVCVPAHARMHVHAGMDGEFAPPAATRYAGREYDDMRKCVTYIEEGNYDAVTGMVSAGRLKSLKDGVPLHALGERNGLVKVRIGAGEYKGRVLWIPENWGRFRSHEHEAIGAPSPSGAEEIEHIEPQNLPDNAVEGVGGELQGVQKSLESQMPDNVVQGVGGEVIGVQQPEEERVPNDSIQDAGGDVTGHSTPTEESVPNDSVQDVGGEVMKKESGACHCD